MESYATFSNATREPPRTPSRTPALDSDPDSSERESCLYATLPRVGAAGGRDSAFPTTLFTLAELNTSTAAMALGQPALSSPSDSAGSAERPDSIRQPEQRQHPQNQRGQRRMLSSLPLRLEQGEGVGSALGPIIHSRTPAADAEHSEEGDSVPLSLTSVSTLGSVPVRRSLRSVKSLLFDPSPVGARITSSASSKSTLNVNLNSTPTATSDSSLIPRIPLRKKVSSGKRRPYLYFSPKPKEHHHHRSSSTAPSITSTSTSTPISDATSSPVPSAPPASLSSRLSLSNLGNTVTMRTKKSTESVRDRFVSIRPRVSGVFTPSALPPELWLLILRYATAAPFVPLPGTPPLSPYATTPFSFSSSLNSISSPPSPESSSSSSSSSPSEPVCFLTHPTPHTHFSERLRAYNAQLAWKAALTRVCRVWNWVGQEVLYEDVWIGRGREGRALAGRLCGDVEVGVRSVVRADTGKEKEKGKSREGAKGLGWFKRKEHSGSPPTASNSNNNRPSLSRRPSFGADSPTSSSNVGRFIRRLHIETPSMEKCSPHDLLIILQYAPLLEVFEDYRSVRRPMHPLVLGGSDVVPFSSSSSSSSSSSGSPGSAGYHQHHQQEISAPDALLHTLLSRPLKKLSWTNYDYDPSDFELGVRFYEDVVGPRLRGLPGTGTVVGAGADKLEFLEISLSGGGVGMGGGVGSGTASAWGVAADANRYPISTSASASASASVDEEDVRRRARMRASTSAARSRRGGGSRAAAWVENPQAVMPVSVSMLMGTPVVGAANLLTELRADYTTTTTTTTYTSLPTPPSPSSTTFDPSSLPSPMDPTTSPSPYTLTLPNLRSLKATLDNATFFVLSTWDMPVLSHLSVMSADFAYAGAGFRRFFEVHGGKIVQLELGHSSGDIEEAWVTMPPAQANLNANANANLNGHGQGTTQSPADQPFSVPLNEWCPNLKQFICSADAEWNWQSPDWIAPHVLLPTHPGLQFIGVRDMERRLVGDADDAARRRRENQGLLQGQGQEWDEDPYFMLLEQFGSLLRKEAFPSLLYVRDMSRESDLIRKTGRMPSQYQYQVSAPANPSLGMGMDPLPRWLPMPTSPYVAPLQWSSSAGSSASAGSSGSSSSSSASSLSLFSGSARRFISRASPLSSASSSSSSSSSSSTTTSTSSWSSSAHTQEEDALAHAQGLKVLRFWERVLERCNERGVWLEDWRGVNVTQRDLRRAAAKKAV